MGFSLGLILVVVAGAKLFTGNNRWRWLGRTGKISTLELLRNWAIVCCGNFIVAAGLALLVCLSRHPEMNNGAIAQEYLKIAKRRCPCRFGRLSRCALQRPCLHGGMDGDRRRSVADKVVAIVFPISAFDAAGFEHSVANMYFIPLAMLLQAFGIISHTANSITFAGLFGNLVPVILGNIVGGGMLAISLLRHLSQGVREVNYSAPMWLKVERLEMCRNALPGSNHAC